MKSFLPVLLVIGGILFLSAVNAGAQTGADGAPAFDKSPSVVLDLWKYGCKGNYKDNVKFSNATLYQNVSFNTYGYDEKKAEWTLIGIANLKEYSDTDTVQTSAKIKNYRWFAIHALSDISFNAQAVAKSNDILITIYDDKINGLNVSLPPKDKNAVPAFNVPSSVVVDLWQNKGKGKYEDNIKIYNKTKKPDASYNVFAYDEKNGRWILIGTKKIGKVSVNFNIWIGASIDPDTIDSPWINEIEDFRWLAVYSVDDISFDAQVVVKRNDVNITVVDK